VPGHGAHGERRQSLPRLVARPFARLARSLTLAVVAGTGPGVAGCSKVETPPVEQAAQESTALRNVRQVFTRVPGVLARNHRTFNSPRGPVEGFGAGEVYPQIWLRDSAWLVPAAARFYDVPALTSWLDLHLDVAEKSGRLRDWVAAASPETFREWAPRVSAVGEIAVDTNTNESDQEPSAALAYCRMTQAVGEAALGDAATNERRRGRLVHALDALIRDRTDGKSGLIWSGLTADWGDVSPLYPDQRAIYFDAKTPRTVALYTNVMVASALECLANLEPSSPAGTRLLSRAQALRSRIGRLMWIQDRGYFRIRLPLNPAPKGFEDDDGRFALGGNALAVLNGVADDEQAASIFKVVEGLRATGSSATISTTLIPPYAALVFQHPSMREPHRYQNGGQWDWFGAAMVEAEFTRGHSEQARRHLDQIASRILKGGGGINEWYATDGSPQGSASYAAAAAAIHNTVVNGLLGISRSTRGFTVVNRTAESHLPFELDFKAAGGRIAVSQQISASAIDIRIQGSDTVLETCSLVPEGYEAVETTPAAGAATRHEVRVVGRDSILCADTSAMSSQTLHVTFAIQKASTAKAARIP
jgi:hypothetical protein